MSGASIAFPPGLSVIESTSIRGFAASSRALAWSRDRSRPKQATARDELRDGDERSGPIEVLAKRGHRPQTARRRSGAPGRRSRAGSLLQQELEVEHREPRVLARDLLGTSAVTRPHRLDEHPVPAPGDDEDLLLACQGCLRREQRSRRGERQGVRVRDRSRDRVASGEVDENPVVLLFSSTKRSRARCPATTASSCSVIATSSSSSDGDSSRSAANRAAVPSRTPRSSIASATSSSENEHTANPPPESGRSSPSCASVPSASRSGVLETPSLSASPISGTRCSAPRRRRRSARGARASPWSSASRLRRHAARRAAYCMQFSAG